MTPAQIELVQDSFRKVLPIKDTAGELFYNQLFTLDPELRPLFPEDLKPQIQKLMSMIATAVGGLTKLETIVGYGVKDKDYDTVGAALLWTLEKGLGDAFTPETKAAWAACYGLLAATMKDAAHSVAAE